MKVYLAGYLRDPEIRSGIAASKCTMAGHELVSRWHTPKARTPENREALRHNYEDLAKAEALLVLTASGHSMRGAHVEIGWAIRASIPIVVYGDPSQYALMAQHPNVVWAQSWNEVFDKLLEIERNGKTRVGTVLPEHRTGGSAEGDV